jgi:hypothetical protein
MSAVVNEVLGANRAYAAQFGQKSELALPPARAEGPSRIGIPVTLRSGRSPAP